MAIEYLHCCNKYVDLDWHSDDVLYYKNKEPKCYEHLLEELMDENGITEEEADKLIDTHI